MLFPAICKPKQNYRTIGINLTLNYISIFHYGNWQLAQP